MPGVQINSGRLTTGNVSNAGAHINGNPSLPKSFSFTLDNTLGYPIPATFMLFDNSGLFAANSGATLFIPTSATTSYASIFAMTAVSPIIIKGYNYQATNSVAQFQNGLKITKADADGSFSAVDVPAAPALRNSQFNPLLQTFSTAIYIDSFSGLTITVDVGEIVTLTLMLGVAFNR